MSVEHYENFPVASVLCPPRIRPAVLAIYHFARTADDIADEGEMPAAARLALLRCYRADLDAIFAGREPSARWLPVFARLRTACKLHGLPHPPLADLLDAFMQDTGNPRHANRAALLDYCRRSANPIGRLLLHLYGIQDALSLRRSDAICTALQLINFWQDTSVDHPRGRVYLPQADALRHGVPLDSPQALIDSAATRALLRELCDWAKALMLEGAPLATSLPGRIGWELRLVVQGGLRVLGHIERLGYATLRRRPKLGARDALPIAWRALSMRPCACRVMTPQQYVQDKAARSGSSFYYAFLFLPPPRRAAITAFYAFCREVDDVVDEVHDPSVAATKLAWWRKEVASSFAGQPSHPVMRALQPIASDYGIEARHLQAVIDGCQMDLEQSRFLDFAGLARYCHLVAGIVGEVACNIFGHTQAQTVQYAHKLGLAMQLTNIIRDVGDDARRGRIYLPVNELQRFDVKAHEILKREAPWGYSERFTALMKFQAERAQATYDEAFALLPEADRQSQKPGLMMANIYSALLREVQAGGFRVLHQRISLTPLRKLWIATRTQWRGR